MLGILGRPIVPFMEIMSSTWMKLVAHVFVNPRKAKQVTYNVRHQKFNLSTLFVQQHKVGWQTLCLKTIPTPTFNNPQNGWLGEKYIYTQTKIL